VPRRVLRWSGIRCELSTDGAKVPVVGASPDAAVLEVKDSHAADGPLPVSGFKPIEIAGVGAAHPPLENAPPVVLERSDRLDSQIREGAQEPSCPLADSRMTSVDDVKRDILVLAIFGEELGDAVDIVPRPGGGPLLSYRHDLRSTSLTLHPAQHSNGAWTHRRSCSHSAAG
jgi:hypothetical protein